MQETALHYWCSPGYLLHIFRIPFSKNTSGGLLLLFHYILDFCVSYRILESIEIKGTMVRRGLKLEEIQLEPLIADNVFLLKNSLVLPFPHYHASQYSGSKIMRGSLREKCPNMELFLVRIFLREIRTRNNSVTLFTQRFLTSHHNIFRGNRKLLENILHLNRREGIYNVKEY